MAKCTNGAKMKHFLTLDVESVGLLGEGFAWATVLTDATGKRIEERYCLGSYVDALGSHADLQWVKANVLPALGTMEEVQAVHLPSPRAARLAFLEAWAETKKRFPETVLVADCPFPVEAHFLIQAFWDNPEYKSLSPYPFLDVASLITSAGGDPLGNLPRENDELPAHHPLHDARQSSRLLHTVL